MDSRSNSSASPQCSPVEPSRRLAVSSLLNSDEVNISFTASNASVEERRDSSERVDSIMEVDDERSTPCSDNENEWAEASADSSRERRPISASQARLRKKQWTSEQVRELQRLYKQHLTWEDIAERLDRSAVACKLKHNKELRRKAPIVMALPHREPMQPAPAPYQVVDETIGKLGSLSHQLHDRKATLISRVSELVERGIKDHVARSKSGEADVDASVSYLQRGLVWEVEQAFAAEQQPINDAWSSLVHLMDQSRAGRDGRPRL